MVFSVSFIREKKAIWRWKYSEMMIYFYSSKEKDYGCFSNFSSHGFELEGLWWPTSEHYFQAQKFAGTPYAEQIRQAAWLQEAFIELANNDAHIEQVWRKVIEEQELKSFPLQVVVLSNILRPLTATLLLLLLTY